MITKNLELQKTIENIKFRNEEIRISIQPTAEQILEELQQ